MNQTLTHFVDEHGLDSTTASSASVSTDSAPTNGDEKYGPWPDELPQELQKDHYPPIHSDEPIAEEGLGSNIRPGDVDCYRVKQDDGSVLFMGFLVLDTRYSVVDTYVLHNECYSEHDPKNYTDPEYADYDQNGEMKHPQRKIYRNVI